MKKLNTVLKKYFRKKLFDIHKTAIIWGKENLIISKDAKIWEYAIIRSVVGKLELGENSRIGPFSVVFTGQKGIKIGRDVMIAPHCVIAAGNYNFKQIEKPMVKAKSFTKGPIIIEDDVWIGANCTVTDGVKIGTGAVIGANSVVNKDVKPYDIVAGNPIKVISNRNS